MYAIIKTGGKQYRVQPGDLIKVEKLHQALGSEVELTDVLMIGGDSASVNVGAPQLKDAKVTVVVVRHAKDHKVIVFKKKRRQGFRKYKTHRQPFTELFIKSISFEGNTQETDSKPYIYSEGERRKQSHDLAEESTVESPESQTSPSRAKGTKKKAAAGPKKKIAKKASPKKKGASKSKSKGGAPKKKSSAKKTSKSSK